jgi:hypothetical protein
MSRDELKQELFWELAEPFLATGRADRSTMMGFPCLRRDGSFFASLDRATGNLIVKLPAARVGELVAARSGEPFAPAGRVFREWVSLSEPDRETWSLLLEEAWGHAGSR